MAGKLEFMSGKGRRLGINRKRLYEQLVDMRWSQLEQYVDTMASALAREQKQFDNFIERQLQTLPDERHHEISEWYAEDFQNLSEEYPRFLWQGVFLTIYTLFEKQMNEFCSRMRRIADKKGLQPKRIPKDDAPQIPAVQCLRRLGLRLPIKSTPWKTMRRLTALRNCIVHNDGHRRDGDGWELVRLLARGNRSIQIIDGHVLFGKEFCRDALHLMRTVLLKTVSAVPRKLL